MERLKDLESRHPEFIVPDSPTQRIGDQPVEGLRQVADSVPMLSIDNTYSVEELRQYGQGAVNSAGRGSRLGGRIEGRWRRRVACV